MSLAVSIQNSTGSELSLHTLGLAAAYLGATIGVSMVVPQIVRTLRNRALSGVSALSWALTALSCLTWLMYGIRADEPPQIPGNVLMVSGCVTIVLAVPAAIGVSLRVVALVLAAAVLVGLAVVLPASALGFVAFSIGLVSALPQTIESLTRPRDAVSAVSVLAWVLRGASQVCWLFYAVVVSDLTVTISATFILASATLLVVLERRRARVVTPAADVLVAA